LYSAPLKSHNFGSLSAFALFSEQKPKEQKIERWEYLKKREKLEWAAEALEKYNHPLGQSHFLCI
jgi:hypothetical protein